MEPTNTRPVDTTKAAMVIGSDLRVRSCNTAWDRMAISEGGSVVRKRINELFPASDIRASILDVLASGKPLEGMLIPCGVEGRLRFLSADLRPVPTTGVKPKEVVMEVAELEGRVLVQGENGEIVEVNDIAAQALGASAPALLGTSIFTTLEPSRLSEAYQQALDNHQLFYLGRFTFKTGTGERIEFEGALVPIDS